MEESDVQKVKRIILAICREHPEILDEPPAAVYFTEFADSSLTFKIIVWIENYKDRLKIIDRINTLINKLFEEENIEIPFPQRDVHIR